MKKKVLIITYYWPPAGGPGVQRWLKFVKYLPHFDIQPIVYVPEDPHYPIADESLSSEIPHNAIIIKRPINEPYKLARLFSKKTTSTLSKGIISDEKKRHLIEKALLYIRGNFFIPDARKNWVNPSVKYLQNYIEQEDIQTIITSGPPHSLHLIGLELKKRLGVKWVADFRDPWTTIGYHHALQLTKASQKKHKALERQVLCNSDQIIVTSHLTKSEFQAITNQPIEVITNGYDDTDFKDLKMDSKFTLSHIGSLLSKRNPEILWKVLSDLLLEVPGFSKAFQLNLIGAVSESIINVIHDYNLTAYVNIIGYVSHDEAILYQKKSQVLLLVEIDSKQTSCIIPGKLFEYMASHRPIIALGPKHSEVEAIINETNTGTYFCYQDDALLKTTILQHYEDFLNHSLQTHPIGLKKYHRRSLTELLSKLL